MEGDGWTLLQGSIDLKDRTLTSICSKASKNQSTQYQASLGEISIRQSESWTVFPPASSWLGNRGACRAGDWFPGGENCELQTQLEAHGRIK